MGSLIFTIRFTVLTAIKDDKFFWKIPFRNPWRIWLLFMIFIVLHNPLKRETIALPPLGLPVRMQSLSPGTSHLWGLRSFHWYLILVHLQITREIDIDAMVAFDVNIYQHKVLTVYQFLCFAFCVVYRPPPPPPLTLKISFRKTLF